MEKLADFLQGVGYHAVLIWPLLPMDLHLILSALFPICAGAHASLSRPHSAAKSPKRKHLDDSENESEEQEQKMEGMSPADAILLPLAAGSTLAGLYYIIKWLEDPEILNKILNWYFSLFGVLALARLITDILGTATSLVSPSMYSLNKHVWEIDTRRKKAKTSTYPAVMRDSPLPGRLSLLPLPNSIIQFLWSLRDLPSQKLRIRVAIRNVVYADVKVGPQGITSFLIALLAQVYFNLVDKPWWLTNALGFSFAYNALQLLSPTTFWTGTLILGALFVYDIYFVFFTPLMVTVATQLDIPAKLLFPRPSRPDDDPAKQALSMLGLGDIVLPGMMIGFALRFDLYLFYLRKQIRRDKGSHPNADDKPHEQNSSEERQDHIMEKPKWYPAKGGWGERFWSSQRATLTSSRFRGTIFPKPYFYATLTGYTIGLLFTLTIMQVFGHAQPALLYLVPGVLGAFWGTAFVKGDIKTVWDYSELDKAEKETEESERKEEDAGGDWSWNDWKSLFSLTKSAKKPEEQSTQTQTAKLHEKKTINPQQENNPPPSLHRDLKNELIFFSINLPTTPSKHSRDDEYSTSTSISDFNEETKTEAERDLVRFCRGYPF